MFKEKAGNRIRTDDLLITKQTTQTRAFSTYMTTRGDGLIIRPESKPFWIPLRHELHRVAPLHHVLDFLPLIDLMNQIRRMVDQTHRRFAGNTGAAKTVDVGDAQAVKTQMRLFDFDEELLPATRRLKWEFHRELFLGLADIFKQRS